MSSPGPASGLRQAAFPLLCLLLAACGAREPVTPLALDSGPGSAEPHLESGPDGTLVLSWLEPDDEASVLRFSTLGPNGWTPPRSVARGEDWFVNWADFPSVTPVSDSLWAAHWLERQTDSFYAYDVAIALSQDGGDSWGEPFSPHRDGTASEHGFVTLFPWDGGVGAIWLDGRNTVIEPTDDDLAAGGMTLRAALISPDGRLAAETEIDGLVCDCCQTDVALSAEGPVAVYRDRSEGEIRDIYVTRFVDGAWQPGRPVAEDGWEIHGCPVNGPAIAARNGEVAAAWFTMAGDTPRVRYARSDDSGRTFGDALDLAVESTSGRVDIALLDDGQAAVSWLEETDGGQGTLVVQLVSPANEIAARHLVAVAEANHPTGFPQLASVGRDLVVAWTDTTTGESRVRAARLRP